jgi:hypothetical protein
MLRVLPALLCGVLVIGQIAPIVSFSTLSSLPRNRAFSAQNQLVKRRSASGLGLTRASLEVMEPSYNLALGSFALGALFGVPGSPLKSKVGAFAAGIPLALFGLFLAFQTTTLRFTFDDQDFALVKADLSSTGENVVVGGSNKWAYDSFVNYDFFPSESFPILGECRVITEREGGRGGGVRVRE